MQITINITKKHLFLLIATFAVLAVAIVYAYNSGNPAYVGHTADEIMVTIDGQEMSLQEAIGEGGIGKGKLVCVAVRRFENPDRAFEIVSYTGEDENLNVNDIVESTTPSNPPWGNPEDDYGFRCKEENGWIMTGCAHMGESDTDTYVGENGCYADKNDGGKNKNALDIICCKII